MKRSARKPRPSQATPRERKFVTGASNRNWLSYQDGVVLPPDMPEWRRNILTDPQTSGGLLISLPPADAAALERALVGAYRIGRVLPRGEKAIALL